MHKRIYSCILLAVLVFSLSGCGPTILQGEDEGTSETEQPSEEDTEEDKTENQTTEDSTTETSEISSEELLEQLNSYFEQIDAEQLPEENRWISAYAGQVQVFVEMCKEVCEEDNLDFADYFSGFGFNLIYVDEDAIPEFAAGPRGFYVSLYTYEPGEEGTSGSGTLHTLMDQWGYGAFGNHGYYYLPEENVLYNYDADYAGSVGYTTYMNLNAKYELVDSYTIKHAYLDEDGNVYMGSGDEDYEPEAHYYYYEDDLEQEISEEEFHSYQIQGDYEPVNGTKNGLEIMEELYQDYLTYRK